MRKLIFPAATFLSGFLLAATDAAATGSVSNPPFITRNPDGTFTVQKQPSKKGIKGTKEKGLAVRPQVVTPMVPAPNSTDDKDHRRPI
jgi:hypothetical protein